MWFNVSVFQSFKLTSVETVINVLTKLNSDPYLLAPLIICV